MTMEKSKYQFERLTPIDDVELGVYEDAINYVFDNPDIKNVAISGAYSAGKSSVLESYKKRREDLHFLHISLAHFQSATQDGEKDVKETILEGKILNQLMHQIPSEKIPQTNFRIKNSSDSKNIIKFSVFSVIFFVMIVYFICFESWKSYVVSLPNDLLKSMLLISIHPYALMIDGILIALLLLYSVYTVAKFQSNKNIFRKVSLQGNEIEIFEGNDDSYFDKYLNEVLYLFENADADVIVFEDMDRFNANQIFERLREVNSLVNIRLKKLNKKPVRFFYLLRDDVFVSKDRTKFFDYIIPIVPVVDSSNSYDQIISHFKKCGFYKNFNEGFLNGLSLYIDDMRVLKNIYNEFLIYYNRLNTTELDCNKMLAIIAYKNLFPQDFADLQLKRGFVYSLFSQKNEFIDKEISSIREQISEKNEEIDRARDEHLKTVEELDIVFENKKKNYRFGVNALSSQEEKEYAARKEAIEDKLNSRLSTIEETRNELEQKIIKLQSSPLKDIITRENISEIFGEKFDVGVNIDFKEIKDNEYFDLLKYLIWNGYIDETYADYMTYFYENCLSRIDKIFLRSVMDKRAKEYTYKLKNPELVVSRLGLVDFDQEEILNFDLLTYLLHSGMNDNYISRFIDQLKSSENFEFIGLYFDITMELPIYINYLNMRWPELFRTAVTGHYLTEKQIYRYSLYTMYYSDDDSIKLVNGNNCLRDYISNEKEYLAINEPNIDRLIHCFKIIGVSFTDFNYEKVNMDLFLAVYEKELYEINERNLRLIQREVLKIKSDEDIVHKNYTQLYLKPDSAITLYVNRNINEYFNVVLQMCNGIVQDDEKVVIAILNNSELSNDNKQRYISFLESKIELVKEITDDSLWSALLDSQLVNHNENNIMDFFNAFGINDSFIRYINEYTGDLDFSNLECDNSSKEKLFNAVIRCNSIENQKYRRLLLALNIGSDEFNVTGITNDKVGILIDEKIIKMTAENLIFIRETYSEKNSQFIYRNIENYIEIMNADLFSQSELLEILDWDVNDEFKLKLLEFSFDEIPIIGKNYSSAICLHIMNNNFMIAELPELFSTFENWDVSIRKRIFDYATENMPIIIDNADSVSSVLKNDILKSNCVDREYKTDLVIAMLPNLSVDEVKDLLLLLGLTGYLKIFEKNSRPKFKINSENEKLLEAFCKKKLIDNYVENSEKAGYYKIIKHKHTAKALTNELL